MKKPKVYAVSDLFYTSWKSLSNKAKAETFALYQQQLTFNKDTVEYGYLLIQVLRKLLKNPRLVDRIDEEQAVDIFNDLVFLKEPWFNFPNLTYKLITPEDQLARHTFDHFIYADNEFTTFLATQNSPQSTVNSPQYLKRLVVTLYKEKGDGFFDKECVEERAAKLQLKEWQLLCVFFTFMHVRASLMKRCKTLFPASPKTLPDGTVIEQEKVKPTGPMWLEMKHRLAETKPFQGYDAAGRANMYAALDYLEDIAKQNLNAK